MKLRKKLLINSVISITLYLILFIIMFYLFLRTSTKFVKLSRMHQFEKDIVSLVFVTNEYTTNRLERNLYQWKLKFAEINKQIRLKEFDAGKLDLASKLDKLKYYFAKLVKEIELYKKTNFNTEERGKIKNLIDLLIGQIRLISQDILYATSRIIKEYEAKIAVSQKRSIYFGAVLFVHLLLFSINSFLPIKNVTNPLQKLVESIKKAKNTELEAGLSFSESFSKFDEIKVLKNEYNELIHTLKNTFYKLKLSIKKEKKAKGIIKKSNLELKKALEKAEEANLYKTEFLANMSHEIRTPLTAILGYNELMVGDENLTQEQRENIDLMQKSGKRLLHLLMDILTISQIEANKSNIVKEEIDLEAMCEDLYDLNALKLKSKKISLSFKLNGIKKIYTDGNRLCQILLNLIGNSIKYVDGGDIKVEVNEEDGAYLFSVKDNGTGIKEEIKDKIFESFVTGETGYTRVHEGTGLGLNICSRLVGLLGGEIRVESALGKGSTFYFTIAKEKT